MSKVRLGIGVVAFLLVGACVGEVRLPSEVAPSRSFSSLDEHFEQAQSEAVGLEEFPQTIDPSSCEGAASTWPDFGSGWMLAWSPEADSCLVWLGGETENPLYDGRPTQFCVFDNDEPPVTVLMGQGGPARIDHPDCADLPQL